MRTPLTTRPRRVALALAACALLATGATACEPPLPPPVFTVDPDAAGADAAPGNGVCATAGDLCSLQAAVEEANALATRTTIEMTGGTVPDLELTVTGTIDVVAGDEAAQALFWTTWIVAEGAQLTVTDALLGRVEVDGTFLARRVIIGGAAAGPGEVEPIVEVGATGAALVSNAHVIATNAPFVTNAGVLSVHGVTVSPQADGADPIITTEAGGQTRLSATAVLGGPDGTDVCAGEAPTSYGYNLV
ncbi:MAG TPA: hypothetical protein VF228_13035, partial [Iamia sp.]